MSAVLQPRNTFFPTAAVSAREAPLNAHLENLREIAGTLLTELDSMQRLTPNTSSTPVDLKDAVKRFEIDLISATLERTHGNQSRAARLLGVKNSTLNAKVKKYQLG